MPGVIAAWAIMRGLNSVEAAIKAAAHEQTFETVTREQLDIIERKLDTLIGAPFRQARMYFREGNMERSREKLIESMSLNELDLPAAALYCSFIRHSNPSLALECYEDILRKFGPHANIVPDELLTWAQRYIVEAGPLGTAATVELCPNDSDPDYYPSSVFCSPWNVVVKWEFRDGRGIFSRLFGVYKPRLIAYDWSGRKLLDLEKSSFSILAVTGEYVVIDAGSDGAVGAWNLSRGAAVPTRLSAVDVTKLFAGGLPAGVEIGIRWPENLSGSFGGTVISVGDREYQHWTYISSGSQYGGGHWGWEKRTSGKLVITRGTLLADSAPLQ